MTYSIPKSSNGGFQPDMAVGDSIAWGLINLTGAGIGGCARVGASPMEVCGYLQDMNPDDLRGENVVLSSGLTNDQREASLKVVEKQLELLEKAGAHVKLLGVSNENAALSGYNKKLKELAERHGAEFTPLTSTETDPLLYHPDSKQLLTRVRFGSGGSDPALTSTRSTVQPAGEGAVQDRDLTHTDSARAIELQELIKKADPTNQHYNLGSFGKTGDGRDGIVGGMTTAAVRLYEDEHGLSHNASVDEVIASLRKNAGAQEPGSRGTYAFNALDPHPLSTPGHGEPVVAKKTQITHS